MGIAEDSSDIESEDLLFLMIIQFQVKKIKNLEFSTFLQNHDFGYLKKPVPNNLRMTIVQHGPEIYQHKSSPFAEKDGRSSSRQWFEKVSTN